MSPVAVSYLSISGYVFFWIAFAVAFVLFAQRVYFLVRLLRLGRPENRFDRPVYRTVRALLITASQWCNLKSVKRGDFAGIGHAFMFWGFGLFLLSYLIFIGLSGGFGLYGALNNNTFETIFSSILDIAAILIIISLIWAMVRRYIVKPFRLSGHPSSEAGIILAFVFSLMVLHLLIEGFNIASSGIQVNWPPIGAALAGLLKGTGITTETSTIVYRGFWWLHYLLILGFLAYIPRSKHLHILASSINVVFQDISNKGSISPVDISKPETFGVAKIQDFSWKQLLDGFACAVCGRCHAVCPAQASGKPLSPRELILKLKDNLMEVGPGLLKEKIATGTDSSLKAASVTTENKGKSLIGGVISENEIWACTTCRACQEVCPSANEPMNKIIEMRRNLQMVTMTETARDPLKNLRVRGHPWRGTTYARTDWAEGLDIPVIGEDKNVDILLWVGCTEAMEDRSIKVAQATAKVLKAAGVKFGILGEEESCCGDPARRLGAEHIFQLQAQNNIQTFQMYAIKKIVTACPHCFNTLKNEYAQFGGKLEVVHHTQFIADLINQNKLPITRSNKAIVTYHESCYLGRYNDIYHQPRQILGSLPDIKLVEMTKNRQDGFCCGGGGGRMWLEENIGERISELRLKQALETKAQVIATACPYCLQMFEDAAKARGVNESLKIKDIAELTLESMEKV